jgi:hypothetical protein
MAELSQLRQETAMQVRPIAQAAALATAMLYAGGVYAHSNSNPDVTGPHPGGTASPDMKAKAESLKQSVRKETHKLHQKIDAQMDKSKNAGANDANREQARSTRSDRERSSRTARESSGNNMGSTSFQRAMAKCTSNEDMNARADCAREAVAAHGGSPSAS